MVGRQKIKHRIITGSSNSTSRTTHRRIEAEAWTDIYTPTLTALVTVAKRWGHPGVPRHMNGKKNVVHTYNGTLFSFKKEENSDTYYIHEPQGHYAM